MSIQLTQRVKELERQVQHLAARLDAMDSIHPFRKLEEEQAKRVSDIAKEQFDVMEANALYPMRKKLTLPRKAA
jgi:hypothetical protein